MHSVSVVNLRVLILSAIVPNVQKFEMNQHMHSIRENSIQVVLEKLDANHVMINVASYTIPEVKAGVPIVPIVLILPPYSLKRYVKVSQSSRLIS